MFVNLCKHYTSERYYDFLIVALMSSQIVYGIKNVMVINIYNNAPLLTMKFSFVNSMV